MLAADIEPSLFRQVAVLSAALHGIAIILPDPGQMPPLRILIILSRPLSQNSEPFSEVAAVFTERVHTVRFLIGESSALEC